MPVVGTPSTSQYLTVTRDKLITMAHQAIGVLPEDESLSGDQVQVGIDFLGLIVREVDKSGRWRWTIEQARHIPLVANTYLYTADTGVPDNIAEPVTAYFRDANGKDRPVDIIKAEQYEAISDKIAAGDTRFVYLTDTIDLALRAMHTWPSPSAAATQSTIDGPYRCIRSHESDATNEPVTGANWRVYWEEGGDGSVSWVTGTAYTAPPQIRLLYRRPIVDFVSASSLPDLPMQWPRLLVYRLAFDLGDVYSVPLDERNFMINKAKGAVSDIFPSTAAKSTKKYNKVKFF